MNNQELLDLFAAQAMLGMISNPSLRRSDGSDTPITTPELATAAYEVALAMMEERKKHLIPQTTEHITN